MPPVTRLVVSLVLTTFATTSAAASVTWEFSGVVTFVDRGVLDESVTVGTSFSGVLIFDPEVPDSRPESYAGGYLQPSPPAEFRVRVGTYEFRSIPDSSATGPVIGFSIYNDRAGSDPATPRPGHDEFSVQSGDNLATGTFATGPDTEKLVTFGWILFSGSDPLSSDALPAGPPTLDVWGVNSFEISANKFVLGSPFFTIRGSVSQVVPEPGAGAQLGISLALLILLNRDRLVRKRARGTTFTLLVAAAAVIPTEATQAQGIDRFVSNLFPPDEIAQTQSETSIAAAGSIICVAWNDSDQKAYNLPVNGYGSSTDGGVSFQDRGQIPLGPVWPGDPPTALSVPASDPSLAYRTADESQNARFLFTSIDLQGPPLCCGGRSLMLYDSSDCSSFTFRSRITSPNSLLYGGADKEFLAVDNSRLLPGGSPNPYYRRIYVAFAQPTAYTIWSAYSDDPSGEPGDGWSNRTVVASVSGDLRVLGPWPVVAPNGDVYIGYSELNLASNADVTFKIAKSTNGGGSWAPAADITLPKPWPRRGPSATDPCNVGALNGDIRNFPLLQLAIGADSPAPAGYTIHAVYQYDPGPIGGDVADVFYRRSVTGGGSVAGGPAWEAETRLNDDATSTDQWSPAIAAVGAYVTASWYDRRLDPAGNWFFDRFMSSSADGGITWEANLRISDVSSPVSRNLPHVNGLGSCYHGDYDHAVVAVGTPDSRDIHIVWSDDRRVGPGCPADPNDPNDPYQSACPNPDVYYDRVRDFDADGAPDSVDGCPTVVNSRADVDADGVDDACDTCAVNDNFNNQEELDLGPNPAIAGPPPSNRTTVSGQFDDDADGIGNRCDFDYDNAGLVITASDFNDMKGSVGKLLTLSTCGAEADQRCGKFDHDGLGAVVSATDFNKTKMAVGGLIVGPPPEETPWKKMSCGSACTPPLSAPLEGPGQVILGKAICRGAACP